MDSHDRATACYKYFGRTTCRIRDIFKLLWNATLCASVCPFACHFYQLEFLCVASAAEIFYTQFLQCLLVDFCTLYFVCVFVVASFLCCCCCCCLNAIQTNSKEYQESAHVCRKQECKYLDSWADWLLGWLRQPAGQRRDALWRGEGWENHINLKWMAQKWNKRAAQVKKAMKWMPVPGNTPSRRKSADTRQMHNNNNTAGRTTKYISLYFFGVWVLLPQANTAHSSAAKRPLNKLALSPWRRAAIRSTWPEVANVCVCVHVCALEVCFSIIYLLTALRRTALSAPAHCSLGHQAWLPAPGCCGPLGT